METILYRIHDTDTENKKSVILQKYVPIDLSGREFHRGTSAMIVLDSRDKLFFSRYQPVYCLKIKDTQRLSVFQYFHVPHITPNLLQIRETKHLFSHFRLVSDLIFREVIYGTGFIKGKVQMDSPNLDSDCQNSWQLFDSECRGRVKDMCEAVKLLPDGFLKPFCTYPCVRFTRTDRLQLQKTPLKKTSCGACVQRSRVAIYSTAFKGEPYDPLTFEAETISKEDENEERNMCQACKIMVEIMWKLMHHKWYLYATIRGYVSALVTELDPEDKLHPQETIDSLLNDYEWLGRSFIEFQVLLAQADTEMKRLLEKNKRRRPSNSSVAKPMAVALN